MALHSIFLIQDMLGDFHTLARQRLEIEDMEYQIDTETVMIKGDFPDERTKACVVPHSEGKHKLLFFTGSLCSIINIKFSKIYNADTFSKLNCSRNY